MQKRIQTKTPRVVQRVNVDFPLELLAEIDREAARIGVSRQSLIKIRIAATLQRRTATIDPSRMAATVENPIGLSPAERRAYYADDKAVSEQLYGPKGKRR